MSHYVSQKKFAMTDQRFTPHKSD